MRRAFLLLAGIFAAPLIADIGSAFAQTAFVAPPRSIADITAILDQQKPDAAKLVKTTADAQAQPPAGLNGAALADFFFKRCQARATLGLTSSAIEDCQAAVKAGQGGDYVNGVSRYEQLMLRLYRTLGDHKKSIEIASRQIANFQRQKGRLFSLNLQMLISYLALGDVNKAEGFAQRNRALLAESRNWQNDVDMYRSNWTANVEDGNGRIYEARGRIADAEKSYHRASGLLADALKQMDQWPNKVPREFFETGIDWEIAFEGRAKAKQGRMAEAESDVRRALLSRLSKSGKYHPDTAGILGIFAWVLSEQGRNDEAGKLTLSMLEIYRGMNFPDEAPPVVGARLLMAQFLNLQRRYEDSTKVYQEVDKAVANWEPSRREAVTNSMSRVNALLYAGNAADALEMAKKTLERERARAGEGGFNTALAHAFVGMSLARSNRPNEAIAEFRTALPGLLASSRDGDDEDSATVVSRELRVRGMIEFYLGFLSRNPTLAGADIGEETFKLADVVRGHGVERALAASSARASAKDPALAELVRNEQDLKKQIGAQVGTLNNLLSLPPNQRDEGEVKSVREGIAKLQGARAGARKDIARRFPDYANLIDPPPATSADLRTILRDDEALLSFYFGRANSFIWVVRKQGPIQFARVDLTAKELDARVSKLRDALEPQAAMISDIPPFDVALGYELYSKLLKPVETGWKPAKSLIVVTNGALGLLPLSLLPTAPATVKAEAEPMFSDYRDVAWLARTHAVTVVPSSSALRTLRQLPAGKATRERFIAFGDPVFNAEQADEENKQVASVQEAAVVTRGMPLKRRSSPQFDDKTSVNIGMLPRLPDTAEELRSISLALEADPSKVLNLGKNANERKVKATDLSKFKIIAFATHGLVPGELDGLTQPALALSAPDVAGVDGDGLLTMEEILTLKLDADWVVLSACNTGTGSGAGAEAASGLGRAFFYAGTRALLVTNWSVHSQSARELTTDLFRRQSLDAKLTRGEALRQAMTALIDGKGYTDDKGQSVFSYAHPLFWAPYTIIGDGG